VGAVSTSGRHGAGVGAVADEQKGSVDVAALRE